MSKRFLMIIFSVGLISLMAFGAVSASGTWQNPWNHNCWNSGDWTQCCNNSWNSCSPAYVAPKPALCASFVADVTIPDGSYRTPGSSFTKTWRITNNGTTTWNTGYKLFFSSGSQMSGPSWVAMPHYVAPGQTVDLSVNLVAPAASGTYRGNWKLQSDTGTTFGVGATCQVPIWAEITTYQQSSCNYSNCCNYSTCYNNCYCSCPSTPSTPVGWQDWSHTQAPAWPTWPNWN